MIWSGVTVALAIAAGFVVNLCASAQDAVFSGGRNSTFYNPILPGFHPDPSCIFLEDWDNTFFCASSSFNAFPGIPIHASKDLQNWRLIGHVLNRKEQLPRLAETNRSTSGIWAPTLRYHNKNFYVVTTLVNDHLPQTDASRWDNIIFKGSDPYDPASWSVAKHFVFEGYDTDAFWDSDGKSYITAAYAWQVNPGIWQAEANLDTGEVGEFKLVWKGTGGMAPEGPHIYKKEGYYYLLLAEGGTGLEHGVTIARSKNIDGPFEGNPANPVLTNYGTNSYFQTIGHADLFQDASGNWWGVALSTRGGPEYTNFPMVRETVMTPVTWKTGEWPVFSQVKGTMTGWEMPRKTRDIRGTGQFVDDGDDIQFSARRKLPPHFTYWRYPIQDYFVTGPSERPNALRLNPSNLNLTALNGNYAGPTGQAFVGRRQSHTLFTYSVNVDFSPTVANEEFGVSAFLTQNHHIDLGMVLLPDDSGKLALYFRYRAMSYKPVPAPSTVPVPTEWAEKTLTFEIKASNMTHFAFSVGPADAQSLRKTIAVVNNTVVSWGFTGVLLGVYCTTNGGEGGAPAYVTNWKYVPQGQYHD